MRNSGYPKPPSGARITFYALRRGRCLCIQGPTMRAVMIILRALCPGGSCREALEARS